MHFPLPDTRHLPRHQTVTATTHMARLRPGMWQARCVRRSGSFASAAGTPKTKEFRWLATFAAHRTVTARSFRANDIAQAGRATDLAMTKPSERADRRPLTAAVSYGGHRGWRGALSSCAERLRIERRRGRDLCRSRPLYALPLRRSRGASQGAGGARMSSAGL